jgi:cytochrome oxidase Cu insertion factor (SCO1/SenC/PrrC family)
MALRAATPGSKRPAASAPPPAEGRVSKIKIPDTPVYDQDGRKLRFYTDLVKGRTVAINFMFTTCTTICPPLAANFRRVQQRLGDRVGKDISLISVSVDPTVDIAPRLKSFLNRYHAERGWSFVSGRQSDIDALLAALGAAVSDKNAHTPMVLVGNDPAGYWTRTYGLASATTLLKVIDEAAAAKPAAKVGPP